MNNTSDTKAEEAKKQASNVKLIGGAGFIGSSLVAIGIWVKKWLDAKEKKKSHPKRK